MERSLGMDLPVPLAIVLAAVAWFGHAFWLTVTLNWCYAQPWNRRLLKSIRAVIALAVFLFPFGAAIVIAAGRTNPLVLGYCGVCAAIALIYLPIISSFRARRRPPAAIVDNQGKAVDFVALMGDKPVGSGKYWRLACLPGNQVFQVEFCELTVRLPRLPPAWDGLAILHLSDLHLCGTPG